MTTHYEQDMIDCAIALLQLKYGLDHGLDQESDYGSDQESDYGSNQESDYGSDNDLVTCDNCDHQWDGFAQCMCLGISYSEDEEDEEEDEIRPVKTHKMKLRSDKVY